MDWKRALTVAGGVGAFAAAVGTGALAIVSLMPGERPGASGENALLMETATPLKPFDEPPKPAPRPEQPVLRERPAIAERRAPPAPAMAFEPSPPAETEPGTAYEPPPVAVAPAAPPPPPVAAPRPPRREAPRMMVAAAPPASATLPIARQPQSPAPSPLPSLRPPPERRSNGVLTPSEIRRIRLSLRLTRDQEPYWTPVEQALLEIGAQQAALVRSGQNPSDAFGIGAGMRMYSVARPLLEVLREDQKAQVRERARAMGFGNVASSI